MANKFKIPLAPVVGVVAGQTATLEIPIGPRYHVIWLEGTVTKATNAPVVYDAFGLITVKINGKPVRTHTAAEINAMNTLMGASFAATCTPSTTTASPITFRLPLFFCEPWRKQYAETDAMAWPTSFAGGKQVGSFQIEIEVPPATPVTGETAGARTAPSIQAFCEIDNRIGAVDANGNPILNISKWNRLTVPYTGTDDCYITTLPRREIYQQISISQGTDAITSVVVKVDGAIIHDATKARNDVTITAREMNPNGTVSTRYDLVFDYDDDPKSALLMQYGTASVQDFQVIPKMATANASAKILTLLLNTYGPV